MGNFVHFDEPNLNVFGTVESRLTNLLRSTSNESVAEIALQSRVWMIAPDESKLVRDITGFFEKLTGSRMLRAGVFRIDCTARNFQRNFFDTVAVLFYEDDTALISYGYDIAPVRRVQDIEIKCSISFSGGHQSPIALKREDFTVGYLVGLNFSPGKNLAAHTRLTRHQNLTDTLYSESTQAVKM